MSYEKTVKNATTIMSSSEMQGFVLYLLLIDIRKVCFQSRENTHKLYFTIYQGGVKSGHNN